MLNITPAELLQLSSLEFPQGRQGLDDATIKRLDSLLTSNDSLSFIAIDAERASESYEAWVHVRVGHVPSVFDLSNRSTYRGKVFGLSGAHCVLTWPNSD